SEQVVRAGAHHVIPLVGASGGLFGILIGAALLFPKLKVMLLIPPVPMTLRTMALIFLGIALFSILVGSRNAGGQVAHLGGAAMGYVLIRYPGFIAWADRIKAGSGGGPSLRQRVQQVQEQRASQQRMKDEQEVDRILAKVREHGLHSLTQTEQRTLQRETQRKQSGDR
ncbi:MAG: rhomboid family intramembrane serine protease, partial [Phycisphaeraceae bacterium]